MSVPQHSLEGTFQHKLDAKLRLAVPAPWRPMKGEVLSLRLLRWRSKGIPVLKALTNEAFEKLIESINANEKLGAGQRSQAKDSIYAHNEPVTVNEQGKVPIPKRLANEEGLEAGCEVDLYGRGTNFDMVSPRYAEEMRAKESGSMQDLYDIVEFN